MTSEFRPTTTAEHLLMLLARHGIEHFFLNPGTDSAPLQEAMRTLPAAGIEIPTVHTSTFESVSLAAAHAYFQATGRPQCLFVHVDSGTQNLGAMLHDTFRDRAGVIILAGKTPYGEAVDSPGGRSRYIQWLQDMPDQTGIVRAYTRWTAEITHAEMLDRALGRAVQIASTYPAGPVYLTVSRDVLMDPPDLTASRTTGFAVPRPPALSNESLNELALLVANSSRPVLLTSRIGRTAAGFRALTRLAELAGITVVRGAGGGPVPMASNHPLLQRSPSAANEAIKTSDLLLIAECDVPYVPKLVQPDPGATVVHVDPDPLMITMPLWAFPVDHTYAADGPTALAQLGDALATLATNDPTVAARFSRRTSAATNNEATDAATGVSSESNKAISPAHVIAALNDVLDQDDVVIEEAVTNSDLFYQELVRTKPNTLAGAFAPGLGWALGGAIGRKLAEPHRRVVSVCGDGSFLFAVPSSALQMAADYKTAFVTVILNNSGYRASRLPVYELFPDGTSAQEKDAVGTRFSTAPDFAALAAACGAHGERVTDRALLRDALQRAFAATQSGRCAVLDVAITQN